MNTELLHKYSGAVPRYTSYPTAPHFHEGIDNGTYRRWLGALGHRNRLSLYLHIPYCDRLCWFCACHTKHTLKYEPIAVYLEHLSRRSRPSARLFRRMRWWVPCISAAARPPC